MKKQYIFLAILILLALVGAYVFKVHYFDNNSEIDNERNVLNNQSETQPTQIENQLQNENSEFSNDYMQKPNIQLGPNSNLDE